MAISISGVAAYLSLAGLGVILLHASQSVITRRASASGCWCLLTALRAGDAISGPVRRESRAPS